MSGGCGETLQLWVERVEVGAERAVEPLQFGHKSVDQVGIDPVQMNARINQRLPNDTRITRK